MMNCMDNQEPTVSTGQSAQTLTQDTTLTYPMIEKLLEEPRPLENPFSRPVASTFIITYRYVCTHKRQSRAEDKEN